jgi:hypothetical protein
MATIASTNLNRLLRLTANLLFEKKEDPKNVARLMEGFVTNAMINTWYEQYCKTNGISTDTNLTSHKRRLPMPPIDWQAVDVKTIDQMLNSEPDNDDEPDW